jgi:hypothetical protein
VHTAACRGHANAGAYLRDIVAADVNVMCITPTILPTVRTRIRKPTVRKWMRVVCTKSYK